MKFSMTGPMERGNYQFEIHAAGCTDIKKSERNASSGSFIVGSESWKTLLQEQLDDLNSNDPENPAWFPEHFKVHNCARKSLTAVKALDTLFTDRSSTNSKGDNTMKTASKHVKRIKTLNKAGKSTGEIALALGMKRNKSSRRAIRTVLASN